MRIDRFSFGLIDKRQDLKYSNASSPASWHELSIKLRPAEISVVIKGIHAQNSLPYS